MASRRVVIEFLGKDKSLGSTADSVTGKTSKLGERLKSFGRVAAVGFAAAGAAAIKFGVDSIGKASDLNETLSKSEVIFGRNFAAVDRWAKGAATSMGLSRQSALEAASGFGDMFSQIGFAGAESAKMSKQVVQLSADLGSFNNLPTAEVADMMSAAFRGEYDSLQRVIPNINAARVESAALAMTGKKVASELTAQEKAAATLAIVQKDGARAAGDFERTSGSLANQQKILRAQFENVQAAIGQKLLPVAVKLATWANSTMIPAARELAGWFSNSLIPIFKRVGEVIGRVLSGLKGNTSGNLGAVRDIIKNFVSIVRSLWNRFGKDITAFAKKTWQNIRTVIGGALKVISGIFKVFASLLRGDWKGVWNGIKQILSGAMQVIKGIVKQAMSVLRTLFRVGWSAIKGVIGGVWDGIRSVIRNGADWIVSSIRAIPGRIASIAGRFADVGRSLISAFVNGMRNAGGIVSGIAGNVWDAVRGMLNSAISKINAALQFTISLPGPNITVNPPDIPHLAKGGVVSRPTLALIGEDGPEAVVPLSRKHAPKGALPGGVGAANVAYITVQSFDPKESGRLVEQALIKWQRQTGRPLEVRTVQA